MTDQLHLPVLEHETVQALNLHENSVVVGATYGRGGHVRSIISCLGPEGKLILIDRDEQAIAHADENFGQDERVSIVHASFADLKRILHNRDLLGKVNAILFDFGVSSPQLDQVERGFSFTKDGPLDMRMDQTEGVTAEQWLTEVEEQELAIVLKKFGEERFAKRIARTIKEFQKENSLDTTGKLADLISESIPTREIGKHPATRSFQAIRIAINDELTQIESVLPDALNALAPGGRLVVISFHSLEDRIVKRYFREQSKGDPFPPDLPVPQSMLAPTLKIVGKAVKPSTEELQLNPRARSAVMRAAEKLKVA